MRSSEDRPFQMKKEVYLGENPIFQNTCLCEKIYQPDFTLSAMHFHEFIEISFVVSGSGIHRIWNEAAECRKGDVYIINTGVPHEYFAKDEENKPVVCNLLFDPEDFFEGDLAKPDSHRYCCGIFQENVSAAYASLKARQLESLEHLYQTMEKENGSRDVEWMEALKAELMLFLIAVRRFQKENGAEVPSVKSKEQIIVANTVRYVVEHYGEEGLTLESIADSFYMSKSYLSKMFRNITGEYFSDYLWNVRLKQACLLLEKTELINEEIVHHCGLKDVPNFYRMFKGQFGVTPSQYRRQNRENE